MLNRHDLEDLANGTTFWSDLRGHPEPRKLEDAAPVLALACLDALALARRVAHHFEDTDAPLGAAASDVYARLYEELTSAGVEP